MCIWMFHIWMCIWMFHIWILIYILKWVCTCQIREYYSSSNHVCLHIHIHIWIFILLTYTHWLFTYTHSYMNIHIWNIHMHIHIYCQRRDYHSRWCAYSKRCGVYYVTSSYILCHIIIHRRICEGLCQFRSSLYM